VDPRLSKQLFEDWAREWWEVWSADPDRSPASLQSTEGRLRNHLLPALGTRQLRAITASVVRRWQTELRAKVGYDTVMVCRSLLNRILQAAEDDRRIPANPVRKVKAPKPPVDTDARLGRAKRRAYTPEEFGCLLAHAAPHFRDHFLTLVGTGMRPGELLGLRAVRVDLDNRRLGVLEVRYEAGKLGRGYKNRPKSTTSIRLLPLAGPVVEAITRQLPEGSPPATLVFAGPGGGNRVKAGTRTELTRDNLRRAYRTAIAKTTTPDARLGYTPRRVLLALREAGPAGQTAEALRARLRGRQPRVTTVEAALCELEAASLAIRQPCQTGADSGAGGAAEATRWAPVEPPRHDPFANLRLRGPHDLRHTFSTWLEDAGIPARVIDELMGHSGGRNGGGEAEQRGSLIGLRYRWTTPEMEARVVAAIEQRLALALESAIANGEGCKW